MDETRGLWRGKRIDNKKWVEGHYFYQQKGILEGDVHYIVTYRGWGFSWLRVDPSTLGECTGLRDKNGKLIFEGDIVRAYYNPDEMVAVGTICYGKFFDVDSVDSYGYLGWCINVNGNCVSLLQPEADGIIIEVIGNIHDNPELLKGDENND